MKLTKKEYLSKFCWMVKMIHCEVKKFQQTQKEVNVERRIYPGK